MKALLLGSATLMRVQIRGFCKTPVSEKAHSSQLVTLLCCQLLRQFREISSLVLNLVEVERGA